MAKNSRMNREAFWINFDRLLLKYHKTMIEVQNDIGKTGSYLYVAKCNLAIPSLDILWAMADSFGCSLDEVVGRETPERNDTPEDELAYMMASNPVLKDVLKKIVDTHKV